ncbi:MAG: zinc ribbon domain-containing protein [Porcipelethomonas sp.]
MSKYCMQCGKEIEDNSKHCPFCGSLQDAGFEEYNKSAKKKSPGGALVPIVAVCAAALAVGIVVLNLTVLNKGYEKPIDNLLKAMETGDGDYLEDVLPDYVYDDDGDFDKLATSLQAGLGLIYGDDLDISYDVTKKKDISDEKLKKLEESIESSYDESVNVSGGYELDVDISIEGDKREDTNSMTLKVYKIDGDWCITEDISSMLF